ncbi:MAG: hypothetical protein SOW65_02325, partial [Candidatus Enterosoma sp.]|nr:hypothetical protein [bacterium]MDY3210665.1 hypothetical protein [Candidatus Enterosoma sp.]
KRKSLKKYKKKNCNFYGVKELSTFLKNRKNSKNKLKITLLFLCVTLLFFTLLSTCDFIVIHRLIHQLSTKKQGNHRVWISVFYLGGKV